MVKDFMREHSVNLMVSSWYEVLVSFNAEIFQANYNIF